MSVTYMAIDRNIAVHEAQKQPWASHDIWEIRVDSMCEGIEKALAHSFVFIAINADNIDYTPFLKVLRDITDNPIIIGTSTFRVNEQIQALLDGADFYGEFGTPEDNMNIAFAMMRRSSKQKAKPRKDSSHVLTYGDLLIVEDYQIAFVKGVEVPLTKTETAILHHLIANSGHILTHKQMQTEILSDRHSESLDHLYSVMKRLRSKLRKASGGKAYIENVRDVGYRLLQDV